MLDVIRHLSDVSLVHMSHIIIKLLNILPLQVGVAVLLLILYNFYEEKPGKRKSILYLGAWIKAKHEEQTFTRDNEVIEILH